MLPFFRRLSFERKILLVVVTTLTAYAILALLALHLILWSSASSDVASWERVAGSAELLFVPVLTILVGVATLTSHRVSHSITRPIVKLITIADEISVGKTAAEFPFGQHVKCWEIKGCRQTSCAAYGHSDVQCWYVDGTPCPDCEPRFPEKLARCRNCEVYQRHRGDEIVQLADAFQHMTYQLRASQAELLRAERLAATGETVAMISHSIRNILDGLMGGVYVFKRGKRTGDEEAQATGWDMVERNLGAISELVTNLLNYAKDRQPFLEPCDLNRMARDVVQMTSERAERINACVVAVEDQRASCVYLDAYAVLHSLVNLVTNALDALARNRPGRVVIAVSCEGDEVIISVSDNGVGITPEVQARLFKGLFSTKGSKGTGLGLLSVQKVVREHGGRLELSSEPGKGTVFRMVLPLVTEPSLASQALV